MVRYITTRSDLLFANLRVLGRSRYLQLLWLLVIVWQCWTSVHQPPVVFHSMAYKTAYCVITGAFYFALLFGITLVLTSVLVFTRKHRGVLGEHTLAILDDGILETTPYNESLYRWSSYDRTVMTKRYLTLYVTDVRFYAVPKQRPLLEGDLGKFETALRQRTECV